MFQISRAPCRLQQRMSKPDYILDLSVGAPGRAAHDESSRRHGASDAPSLRGRPWLAIHWKCCKVYSRVYRNAQGTMYQGRCPRCGREAKVHVGPGGTASRFFQAM